MTQVLTKEEKERILRTLEEDKEFRYAIAGLIGIREILERLDKIEEGQKELWKGQQELWKEVRGLRKNFEQLGKAVGMTLEYYTAAFLEEYLSERGYEGAKVEVGVKLKYMGKTVELDLFCEDPLLVGEVTTGVASLEDARREIDKLLERVNFVKEMYGRDVDIKILAIANVGAEAVEFPFNPLFIETQCYLPPHTGRRGTEDLLFINIVSMHTGVTVNSSLLTDLR
jgi:hypothetical protein